jgi:hypothetical protein
MVYDPGTSTFQGIVQNTTSQTLCRLRVELHSSIGTELGPTNPDDLPAGGTLMGELSAAGEIFVGGSARAETSPCAGGEGAGEHGAGGEGVGFVLAVARDLPGAEPDAARCRLPNSAYSW